MAGHKADTVCVGNSWYARVSPLFTRNCTWFSGGTKLMFLPKPQNKIFLISPHRLLCRLSTNFHQPSLTKHRDVYAGKSLYVKSITLRLTVCYILHTPPFINILFCLLVVFTDVIYIWEYVWKTVSMLARNARISVRGHSQPGWLLLCHVGRLVEASLWTCAPV